MRSVGQGRRPKLVALMAVSALLLSLGLAASVQSSAMASGPVFPVMNTSETPPDGVWFRNNPSQGDSNRETGFGVYAGESMSADCFSWGDAVGPYSNHIWYRGLNVSRPTVDGHSNYGWMNTHYVNDGATADHAASGVPDCSAMTPPPPTSGGGGSNLANAAYNRSAAVSWALAHAQDAQGSGSLCTWFVSQALWAGQLPQTSSWSTTSRGAAVYVQQFVDYFRTSPNTYSVTWTDISSNLATNAVPSAELGDVIVYNWNDGGEALDHMAFVVKIAPGQYPNVSEMGQFDFTAHPYYKLQNPHSSYVQRGWTYSEMHHAWLQSLHPGMKAYLLHFNGGYYAGQF
jgi:Putative amidase domain